MKKLTHIKLFEAFESTKLSKTLNYVKSGKSTFLDQIKTICDTLDFPYSKLSDEYFEYLSFKKALNKSDIVTDEKCTATSAQSYPGYAIDGSVCEDGMVKRKWGKGIRNATCEKCKGTGVKIKKEGDIKLIKFWFDKDGNYIYTSAVDGIIRSPKINKEGSLSTNIDDYEEVTDFLEKEDFLRQVSNGDYARIQFNRTQTAISYIIKETDRNIYAIQNIASGSGPNRTDYYTWRKIANYSWAIGGGDFARGQILKLKGESDTDTEPDPYTWNIGTLINRYGMLDKSANLKEKISGAHFALVMDFGKLNQSLSKSKDITDSRSELKDKRHELKSGSKLYWDDEKIKKQNIERYLDKISKNLNITDDVANVNKLVKRIIGFKYALYVMMSSEVKDNVSSIIRRYYDFLKDSSEYNLQRLNEYTDNSIRSAMTKNLTISDNVKYIKSKSSGGHLTIMEKMDEISSLIYQKISEFDIETIEDLEIIYQRIFTIRNLFSTDRYSLVRHGLQYVFYYLTRSDGGRSLQEINGINEDRIEDIISELDRVKRIIEKL